MSTNRAFGAGRGVIQGSEGLRAGGGPGAKSGDGRETIVSRNVSVVGNSETQVRVALLYLRKLGQRNFYNYFPECWEEPLTAAETLKFGRNQSKWCNCTEGKAKSEPHISRHWSD
jgi:hypothetical protein